MRWVLGAGLAAVAVGVLGLVGTGLLVGTSPQAFAGGMLSDPGRTMGPMMAGFAPEYLAEVEARSLGDQVPNGASVDRARNRLVFSSSDVQVTVLGSPEGGRDMTFRIAGLTNPTVVVPTNAKVTARFINGDADASHGWELLQGGHRIDYMPMMGAEPAFTGSFAMPLGSTSSRGWPAETVTFNADGAGTYSYVCPVAGHAQKGMQGSFVVS